MADHGSYVLYRDAHGCGHRIFEGSTSDCKEYCVSHEWKHGTEDLEMWTVYYGEDKS